MFLMTVGGFPGQKRALVVAARTGGNPESTDKDDDAVGQAIWSFGDVGAAERDPPAKAPVRDRAETDPQSGEPLFVRPDDGGTMNVLGIGGGMLAPSDTPAIIGLVRHRDPRPVVAPYVC